MDDKKLTPKQLKIEIQELAQDAVDMSDGSDVSDYVNQNVDGSYLVIYTHANDQVIDLMSGDELEESFHNVMHEHCYVDAIKDDWDNTSFSDLKTKMVFDYLYHKVFEKAQEIELELEDQ